MASKSNDWTLNTVKSFKSTFVLVQKWKAPSAFDSRLLHRDPLHFTLFRSTESPIFRWDWLRRKDQSSHWLTHFNFLATFRPNRSHYSDSLNVNLLFFLVAYFLPCNYISEIWLIKHGWVALLNFIPHTDIPHARIGSHHVITLLDNIYFLST